MQDAATAAPVFDFLNPISDEKKELVDLTARWNNRPWIVIVEPDNDASLLVVVTVYEVSE